MLTRKIKNVIDIKTVSEYWVCDICRRRLKKKWGGSHFPCAGPNLIEGHKERFCFECWGNGIMWAMKQAGKSGKGK